MSDHVRLHLRHIDNFNLKGRTASNDGSRNYPYNKKYVSYFNIPSKLIQQKSSLNKITAAGSDSEKNVYQPFKDLMPNRIHLLCDIHNAYERQY